MVNRILISRTDSIGDIILTLPMAGILKKHFPDCTIFFLGNDYTKSIIENSSFIDQFLNVKDLTIEGICQLELNAVIHVFPNKDVARLAKKAQVPIRIGTSHRVFHWVTCNKLISFSRKKSDLHEAILNLKLIQPLGIDSSYKVDDLPKFYGWKVSDTSFKEFATDKFNLVIHMKSKGSAAEWPVSNYMELVKTLPKVYQVYITGTKAEGELIQNECPEIMNLENVKDVTGLFNLKDFITFIGHADGLLACSTGPLHIAAASGIHALGLYPDQKPMHAGRWAPIGEKAQFIESNIIESNGKSYLNTDVQEVLSVIESWR